MHDDDAGAVDIRLMQPEQLAAMQLVESFLIEAGQGLRYATAQDSHEEGLEASLVLLLHVTSRRNHATARNLTTMALDEHMTLGLLGALTAAACQTFGTSAVDAIAEAVESTYTDLPGDEA